MDESVNESRDLKKEILAIIDKRVKGYKQSKVKYSELLKTLGCTEEELNIALNSVDNARIYNGVEYDV